VHERDQRVGGVKAEGAVANEADLAVEAFEAAVGEAEPDRGEDAVAVLAQRVREPDERPNPGPGRPAEPGIEVRPTQRVKPGRSPRPHTEGRTDPLGSVCVQLRPRQRPINTADDRRHHGNATGHRPTTTDRPPAVPAHPTRPPHRSRHPPQHHTAVPGALEPEQHLCADHLTQLLTIRG
jgi:hypothetical protein